MKKYTYDDFLSIMDRLLSENGCPWDKAQTHESLTQYLLEECYEAIDAVNKKDMDSLCEELGDVLLEVVFQAKLAEKENSFTMEEVTDRVSRKMINRHRHIFGDAKADTPQAVVESWEEIKKEEKNFQTHTQNLRSVANALPSLIRAEKVQKRAEKAGYAGLNPDMSLQSIQNILSGLPDEKDNSEKNEEFIGSLLFAVVALSRLLQINPEFALTNAIEKFINKFEHMEKTSMFVRE